MDYLKLTLERAGSELAGVLGVPVEAQVEAGAPTGPAAQGEAPSLIVDLADVPYIDSAGLGAILGAFASCQRHGRKFGLIHVSDRVRAVFKVAKVHTILPVFESSEAAKGAFAAG